MRQFYVFIKCELGRTYDVAASLVDNLDDVLGTTVRLLR